MNRRKSSRFMAVFAALLTFFAMSLTALAVDEPKLSRTSAELIAGETLDLDVDNATQEDVTWKSAKEAVATVDKDGVVKAVKAGTVKIKATVYGKTYSCTVKVSADAKISKSEAVLEIGATESLKVITPDGSFASSVTWKSSKKKVATVENGVVKAVKAGSTTITAKVGKKKHTCKVTVLPDTRMTQSKAVLYPTEYLELKMLGSTADSWTSSNGKVATVTDGVVQGVKPGSAKITAKVGKKKYTCTVRVENMLDKKSIKLSTGYSANVKLLGDKISSAVIADTSIATVTTSESTGTIKAVKPGNTRLVISAEGKKKSSYECIVRVIAPLTVRFDANGGSAVSDITTGYGEKIAKPTDPAKEGFRFGGWYVNKECTVSFDFDSYIYSDMTVYAKWNPITYTVKFETDSGSEVESQIVGYKGSAVKPADPVRRRSVFVAWCIDEECTTVFDFSTILSGDITLYAQWREADKYDITFNTNGGSEINPQAVYDTECAVCPRKPVKENNKFVSWFTDPECTAEYDFSTPVTGAFTLYAKWEALVFNWTITDDTDEHEVEHTASVKIASNAQVTSVSYNLINASGDIRQEGTVPAGSFTRTYPSADNYTCSFEISGLMLEDGTNTLKVYAIAEGSLVSEEKAVNYVSGEILDPENTTGLVMKSVSDNTITVSSGTDDLSGDTMMISNLMNLFFKDDIEYTERVAFIENTLKAEKVGELNTIRMMQAKFAYSDTVKELPAIEGFAGSRKIAENSVEEMKAYANALVAKYPDILDDVTIEFTYGCSVTVQGITDDALYDGASGNDWWLRKINAEGAWNYDSEFTANEHNDYKKLDYITKIKLGVVDNGYYLDHEDLENVKQISKFNNPNADHGTHVAGIIAAKAENQKGIAGVTYNNATLLAYDAKWRSSSYSMTMIMAGLIRTVEAGAKVVNYSMGYEGPEDCVDIDDEGRRASRYMGKLLERGYDFVVVQAAGNMHRDYAYNRMFCSVNESNCYSSDASTNGKKVEKADIMNRIIVVGAIDVNNTRYINSNYDVIDPEAADVPNQTAGELTLVFAPGADVLSTYPDNGYEEESGTSMAAPVVTGVAGLVWAINPALNGADVVHIIGTSVTGNNKIKIIDAKAAADKAYKTRALVYGTVVNATTGFSLEDAKITVRKDGPEGEIIEDDIPIINGKYTLTNRLPAGNYCVVIKGAEGTDFAGTYKQFRIKDIYKNTNNLDTYKYNIGAISLSDTSTLAEGQYRIVLHWGTKEDGAPADLDSHFCAMTDQGTYFHAYFINKNPSPSYADLDVDDLYWEGPETITIRNIAGFEGMRYAVHNYSDKDDKVSYTLSESLAYVELYRGTELEPYAVFHVPQGVGGTVWEVFSLDANGDFIEIGDMNYESSTSYVLKHWY